MTITDFLRPSLSSGDLVSAYTGIKSNGDVAVYYDRNFSKSDYNFAMTLLSSGDNSPFVSSILFQAFDTTVLTTEELTLNRLERLNFRKITIRQEETDLLADSCTLHVSVSPYYVKRFVESDSLQKLKEDMQFDEIFANKCEFATGNLMTIKGQHLVGKNLTIIRHLPREATKAIEILFKGCFKMAEDINPVALYYKDSLMQAVGRSIGFRGETDAWVMVHSDIWKLIKDTKWIYKIDNWNVELSSTVVDEIDNARSHRKSLMRNAYNDKAEFMRNDKAARIKAGLIVTGNPKDKINAKDIKQIFGNGYKLSAVASTLNITPTRNKTHRFLEGVKKVA